MTDLGLLVFKKDQAASVLGGLGLEVKKDGQVVSGSAAVKCDCCAKKLTAQNFGAALPGSRMLYCDAPACLVDYVRKKIRNKPSTPHPQLDLANLQG